MAARDDSVIRGSLITCLILLVLSLSLNFILWSWGDTQSDERTKINDRLSAVQDGLRTAENRNITLMKMVGAEPMSQDEYEALNSSDDEDATFNTITKQFYKDMKVYGLNVGIQDRHYGKLTDYFTDAIRSRNDSYRQATDDAKDIRAQATSDIDTARAAQATAETERENLAKQLEDERAQFATYRNDMLAKMERAKDSKTKSERDFQQLQRKAGTASVKRLRVME